MRILTLMLALTSMLVAAPGAANDVVRLVVPFSAGGPVDQVARILAPGLEDALGATVVVENRGGAGGTVGTNYVAKSPPDGRTVLMATSGFVISSQTTANLPYDPYEDLEPLALVGQVQTLLVVRPSLGVNTLAELVKLAKSGKPLSFGSTGVGGTMHVGGELLNHAAGIQALHVPYRGAAPAITALMAGEVDMVNADVPVLQPYVKSGRVKALVIYDTKHSVELPDVPDAVEAGYPQLLMSNWYSAMVPAGTPQATKQKLEQAFLAAIRRPDIAQRLSEAGLRGPMGTADFRKKLDAEFERWVPFLRDVGLSAKK